MNCIYCKKEIRDGAKYCSECGKEQEKNINECSDFIKVKNTYKENNDTIKFNNFGYILKNRKRLIIIGIMVVIVAIIVLLINVFSNKKPSIQQIKNDLLAKDDIVYCMNEFGEADIEKIEVILANTDNDKNYEANLKLDMKNKVYKMSMDVTVKYKYYDTGEWQYQSHTASSAENIIAIAAYPESNAKSNARENYSDLLMESHETNLNNKTDIFVFSAKNTGMWFDYSVKFQDIYSCEKGKWELKERKVLNKDATIKKVKGLWYISDGFRNDFYAYHIDDIIDDNKLVLTEFSLSEDFSPGGGGYSPEKKNNTYNVELINDTEGMYFKIGNNLILKSSGFEKDTYWGKKTAKQVEYEDVWWLKRFFSSECEEIKLQDKN